MSIELQWAVEHRIELQPTPPPNTVLKTAQRQFYISVLDLCWDYTGLKTNGREKLPWG